MDVHRIETNSAHILFLRKVEDYNTQMQAEIAVTRRATYKAEDAIKTIEKVLDFSVPTFFCSECIGNFWGSRIDSCEFVYSSQVRKMFGNLSKFLGVFPYFLVCNCYF